MSRASFNSEFVKPTSRIGRLPAFRREFGHHLLDDVYGLATGCLALIRRLAHAALDAVEFCDDLRFGHATTSARTILSLARSIMLRISRKSVAVRKPNCGWGEADSLSPSVW
jgi:hypothetical protein